MPRGDCTRPVSLPKGSLARILLHTHLVPLSIADQTTFKHSAGGIDFGTRLAFRLSTVRKAWEGVSLFL